MEGEPRNHHSSAHQVHSGEFLSEDAILSRSHRSNQIQWRAGVRALSFDGLIREPSCLESSWEAEGRTVQTFAADNLWYRRLGAKRRPERRMMQQSGNHLMFLPWGIVKIEEVKRPGLQSNAYGFSQGKKRFSVDVSGVVYVTKQHALTAPSLSRRNCPFVPPAEFEVIP